MRGGWRRNGSSVKVRKKEEEERRFQEIENPRIMKNGAWNDGFASQNGS